MKRAKKKYYEKKKQDEEFLQNLREKTKVWTKEHKNDDKYIQTMRANSKQYYEKNREKVLERMRNYNAKKKEQLFYYQILHQYFITKYFVKKNI